VSNAKVHVVNGPDPASYTPQELAAHKRRAGIEFTKSQILVLRTSRLRLEHAGRLTKAADTQEQITALETQLAELEGA
jgi:hypothetical protein